MKRPTTKRQRDRIYTQRGLRPRTRKETREYLDMIQRQGEEMMERGHRLAAAYALDDERALQEREHLNLRGHRLGRFIFRRPMAAPAPLGPGATLRERIAARTAAFYEQMNEPLEDAQEYLRRRRWWEFWRPRWVPDR